jgi:tetratricopeptide (TPR) repeat protein
MFKKFQILFGIILCMIANHNQVSPKPLRVLPFGRNKNFVGRQSQLNRLIKILSSEDAEEDCQRVALIGLGGVGKTQIALECAFQLQSIIPSLSVFWVRASDITSFDQAFREIGQQLKIPGLEHDNADVKRLVKNTLSQESTGKWFLIMDNADNFEIFYGNDKNSGSGGLSEYLPFSTLGAILFTTRDREAATRYAGSNVVDVNEMDDVESRHLLERSLQNKQLIEDKNSTAKLLISLVNLPLAIMQAAAYLNAKGCNIAEYLKIYEGSSGNVIKLLSKDFEDIRRYPDIKNPVATTWLISFEQIQDRDPLAAEYMAFISCVKEQEIPQELLPPASDFEKTEALGTLKAFGFIKERVGGGSYDAHRLVHTAMQNWLKLKKEWIDWNQWALEHIAFIFPWPQHENRALWMMYLPHTQCIIATYNEGLTITDETMEPPWRLLYNLGECFNIQGRYAEAEAICWQTLHLTEEIFGMEHPETLSSMNSLATSLGQQGKYQEAEAINRKTLRLQEKVIGKEHPNTLMSMNNLAESLRRKGQFIEARDINQQTLQLREKVLGKEHPHTLMSMHNLAETLRQQGEFIEAELIHRQTMELKEKVLGKDHPDTLIGMVGYASSLCEQGKNIEAEAMNLETLQLQEKVLGKEHPDTLICMNNLAESLSQQRKFIEATVIHQQTLYLREKVLGKEHPETILSMSNLAEVLRQQGKLAEAEDLERQKLREKKHLETPRNKK